MDKHTILLIENDEEIGKSLRVDLINNGYEVYVISDTILANELINKIHPDLIIIDNNNKSYFNLYSYENSYNETGILSFPLIFLTDIDSHTPNDYFVKNSMDIVFINKPIDKNMLLNRVNSFFKKLKKVEKRYEEKMEKLRTDISFALPHEFRTSINGIVGCTDIIIKLSEYNNLDHVQINEIHDMANSIKESGKQLHRLTENFLFYSQIQTILGKPEKINELRKCRINFAKEIISDVINSHQNFNLRKDDIIMNTENAIINISYFNFNKIIYELLDNAIKFSNIGTKINIESYINDNKYYVKVSDKGRGMTKYQIKDIGAYNQFDRYVYEQQGAGLGLIIAKLLVVLHNGIFEITSELGNGTSIILTLPISKEIF